MKLTAKVIKVESADDYSDKIERITIRFGQGIGMYNELRLPNLDGWQLNEEIVVNLEKTNTTDQKISELARKVAPGSFA